MSASAHIWYIFLIWRRHSSVGQSACLTCMRSVVRAHLSPPKAAPRSFEMCGTDADYLRWHVGFAGQSQNKAAIATFLFTYFTFRFTRSLFTFHPLLLFQTLSFTFSLFTITYNLFWGISAVGSAQHWQCWGQGFKSPMLHQRAVSASDFGRRTVQSRSLPHNGNFNQEHTA